MYQLAVVIMPLTEATLPVEATLPAEAIMLLAVVTMLPAVTITLLPAEKVPGKQSSRSSPAFQNAKTPIPHESAGIGVFVCAVTSTANPRLLKDLQPEDEAPRPSTPGA